MSSGGVITTTVTTTARPHHHNTAPLTVRAPHNQPSVTIMPCSPAPSTPEHPTILLSALPSKHHVSAPSTSASTTSTAAMVASPGSPLITIMQAEPSHTTAKIVASTPTTTIFKNGTFITANDVITVAVSDGADGGALEAAGTDGPTASILGVNSSQAYVEAAQQEYPLYSGDTAMYTTTTMFTATTGQPQYTQEVSGSDSPLPTQTFIVNGGSSDEHHPTPSARGNPQTAAGGEDSQVSFIVSDGGDSDTQANLAQAAKVSPVTVQWLTDNYEEAEGVSLPRSTLYNFYIRHTAENKLDPVNAASFGKLIRGVFQNLRTRRLGTRGNSKYHYYGIKVKRSSPLYPLTEEGCGGSPTSSANTSPAAKKNGSAQFCSAQVTGAGGGGGKTYKEGSYEGLQQGPAEASPQTQVNQQYLGSTDSASIPELEVPQDSLPSGVTLSQLHTFAKLYRDHCSMILEAVYELKFSSVENIWKKFWDLGGGINNNSLHDEKDPIGLDGEGDLISRIPLASLQLLLSYPPVVSFIEEADYQFYQGLVEVLIPDVLRSIPSNLTQSIRNFAKSLEGWLSQALQSCPPHIQKVKMMAVASLGQMLRRYTSLNHLAQAARAVLHNTEQIKQMLQDLNRVDFHNVHEQASWVCGCDEALVCRLEEDFKLTLQRPSSLEDWADWLRQLVDTVLLPHLDKTDFATHARQFLLKWSFYSSMVIRDLTLRSAASFGSFHLIRLLYDEYMFYVVEHKVASALNRTPIAVMAQQLQHSHTKDDPLMNGDALDDSEGSSNPPLQHLNKKVKYEAA